MKNVKTKKVLSSIISTCLILMLLCSTMIVSPATLSVSAGVVGGTLKVSHIFTDGDKANDSYVETIGSYIEGETPVVVVNAPEGYVISDYYFTTSAGGEFVELDTDVDFTNPLKGVYHITMPDEDVNLNIVYASIVNHVAILHLYENEEPDSNALMIKVIPFKCAGDTVFFNSAERYGYEISEIYATVQTEGEFTEVIDLPIKDYGTGTFSFVMPDDTVFIYVVYKHTVHTISDVSYFNDVLVDGSNYIGKPTAAAGEVVTFAAANVPEYKLDDLYVTITAGTDFVELIDAGEFVGTYSFVMPDEDVLIHFFYVGQRFNINTQNIFVDGNEDDTSYVDIDESAVKGDCVHFTVSAPQGYAVANVYATVGAGDDFVEVVPVGNIAGAYYFDMPEGDVTISVEYKVATFNVDFVSYVGEKVNSKWNYGGFDAGETFIFGPEAIRGCSVESVVVTKKVNDAFTEVVPVTQVGSAFYFTMPEADVTVSIIYKTDFCAVSFESYDEGGLISAKASDYLVGNNVIFEPEYRPGYAVESVIATIQVNDLFIETIDLEQIGNVYSFVMPESDVTVTIIYKNVEFAIEINDIIDGEIVSTYGENCIAGETYFFYPIPPMDGYELQSVVAHSANDSSLIYDMSWDIFGLHQLYMPNDDVVIDIVWKLAKTYSVTVNCVNTDGELIGTGFSDYNVPGDEIEVLFNMFSEEDNFILSDYYVTINNTPFQEIYNDYTVDEDGLTFLMPDADITVTLVYEKTAYGINVRYFDENGDVIDTDYFEDEGGMVTNVKPIYHEGYQMSEMFITAIDGVFAEPIEYWGVGQFGYAFYMPYADVNVDFFLERADVEVNYFAYVDGEFKLFESEILGYGSCSEMGATLIPADLDNGAKFIGWYLNGSEFDFTDPIYENMDLIAVYDMSGEPPVVTHTVKFNYFVGEENAVAEYTVINGAAAVAPNTDRFGYTFLGWFDNADGKGDAVTDFTNITADAEYFAVYSKNPVADYSFGEYTVTDSEYGVGFKEIKINVLKNNAEYLSRDAYVIAAAQLKDGTTVLFYVPVAIVNGEASEEVSIILSGDTFQYVDMYIVYGEVDFSGSLNWVDIESNIQL